MLDVMVYPSQESDARLAQIATRKVSYAGELETRVAEILDAVRREGDAALLRYTRQYDAPDAELADLNAERSRSDGCLCRRGSGFPRNPAPGHRQHPRVS